VSNEPFGDIPLFREIQRLLNSGGGPVNLEIARQVAAATAASAGPDPQPDREIIAMYQNAVISAQQLLAGYTRLEAVEPPRTQVLTRSAWIELTLQGWTWLMEDFAGRLSAVAGPQGPGEGSGLENVMEQILPLMMGIQTGALIGSLAGEALFRYELPIPRVDDGRLFLVAPNALAVVQDYGFDRDDFLNWVALRDTGRHLVLTSNPWVESYLRSAIAEVVDSIEIDVSDMEQRLTELQSGGMEGLEGITAANALPVVKTARHQSALNRLRAFFSVFAGYATQASAAVSSELISSFAKLEEGMSRRAASPSEGRQALTSILGISFDVQDTTQGATFCAAVEKLRGIPSLNRVWEAPDNLPSLEEIRDPFAWMERVLDA
jgi:putative hydrolase